MASKLTASDVQKLMTDPSSDNRAVTASKIAKSFGEGGFSQTEKAMAEEIFRVMAKDAEERVRVALSQNLNKVNGLARDLAMNLAKDTSDLVALPMIQFSEALSDEDLVEILKTQHESRQTAVASRPKVSQTVSAAVVEFAPEGPVAALVSNGGANIHEKTLNKVVDTYGFIEAIQEPLVKRDKLPMSVAEKLVQKVSDSLQDYLVAHHDLPDEMATDLILQSRERATLSLSSGGSEGDVEELVTQLKKGNKLTPSIILRALCVGDMTFFETSISVLANVPVMNSRMLIHDEGDLGFRALYEKAGLPKPLLPAFKTSMNLIKNNEVERSDDDPEIVMRRLLERVLTVHEDIVDEYGIENVDYLLTKFNKV